MKRFFQNPFALILIVVMAAMAFLNDSFSNPLEWLQRTLYIIPGILIGITVHEFAHAFVAYKLGDNTPKIQGRVSLNPIRHIDPVGLIALLFIGFGWGKPVEVNPNNFKHTRRDNLLTDIAGIITNVVFAIIFTGIIKLIYMYQFGFLMSEAGEITISILNYIVWINLVLAVFNLIPVPPLDGFGIVTEIFNLRQYSWYYNLYNMGFPILMVLIMFNITDRILVPAMNFLYGFVNGIFF